MKGRTLLAAVLMLPACGGAVAPVPANDAALAAVSPGPATPTPSTDVTPTAASPNPAAQAIAPWDATRCGDDAGRGHPGLMGRSPQALEAGFGAPAKRERFRVGEPAGTFYGELGRRLSGPTHPQAGAPAQALTWTRSGCDLTVLFVERGGASRAVSAFESAVGADF